MGFHERRDNNTRRAGMPALLLTAGGLWALTGGGLAARADASGRTVDVQVQDADLSSVVNLLQRQTGLNFIIQNNGQPFGKVTVGLTHAPFDMALRKIVGSANGTVSRDADGVYVIRPAGAYGTDAGSYSPSDASPAPTLPTADYHWKKIILLHAVPSALLKLAHWDRDLVVPDPFRAVQMPTDPPNVTASNGVQMLVPGYDNVPSVPIGRGNTGGLSANQSVQQANRSFDPSRQANQDFGAPTITTPGGGNFPGGGFPGGGRFRGNGGGFPQPFQQQQDPNQDPNAPGGTGRGSLPEGVDRIYAVEGDNSLLVYANPDGFAKVNDLVKALDVAPRQVQIKVEFVTASVADVDAFGLNFSLVPLPGVEVSNNQGTQANLTGNPQTYVQVATGNVVVQLFNTLVRTRGKVVQAPIITTTNNVPANINVSTQIPFVTTTNIVGGSGNVTSNTSQQFLTITTGMVVQPRINADDTVTLNLSPTITDVAGAPSSTGGPPPTVRQSLTTLRTVRNGETMVLGGLVRKSETNSQSRIPFFADLPILGQLFRNRVTNISDSELLIFVTPTIINENNGEGPGTAAGLNTSVAP